jgi:predicted porin
MRNSFVGLTGGWGTFVVGRNDTPYKTSTGKLDLFADTMADYNGTVGFDDVRADNAIAYVSPNLSRLPARRRCPCRWCLHRGLR